jgi:hypothetical protein
VRSLWGVFFSISISPITNRATQTVDPIAHSDGSGLDRISSPRARPYLVMTTLPWLFLAAFLARFSRNAAFSLDVAAQLKFEAKFESSSSYSSFKRSVPGAFNVDLTGSTCSALPRAHLGHLVVLLGLRGLLRLVRLHPRHEVLRQRPHRHCTPRHSLVSKLWYRIPFDQSELSISKLPPTGSPTVRPLRDR